MSWSHFTDAEDSACWVAARREAIDHVLAAIAASEWSSRLVLRGSLLMKTWFGAWAREPGDLDFVVRVELWRIGEPSFLEMFADLARDVAARSREPGSRVWIDARVVEVTGLGDKYIFGEGGGERLVLSWQGRGQVGTLQLDFAYDEKLFEPPERTEIPRLASPGPPAALWAVSRPLALAWKAMWLAVDHHGGFGARAKDLYDAVLLAEHCVLPWQLFEQVLGTQPYRWFTARRPPLRMFLAAANGVEWREFAEQHPHLAHAHEELVWRFVAGLIPTLPYETRALYRTLLTDRAVEVSELRAVLASGGLPAVAERVAESGWSTLEQVVLVRKLLGRAECSLHQAAGLVAAMRRGLVRSASDYRGLGDPHRIATALAPYV
ncbi:nucleotidyl transferase AbiEii/AbiGii toxin family protein [Nocardia sp. NPDC004604]|uniref:nucleotidyl transferase AbiEii/AbiGii toxin family protein n=1 Tax=Nocardia sp. NPDC004604 TaxID=3157013 RepID=UPI0033AC4416